MPPAPDAENLHSILFTEELAVIRHLLALFGWTDGKAERLGKAAEDNGNWH
jgi:hypothetical protein